VAHPIYQVNAFAEQPFEGNPAAVCLLDRPAEEAWMRRVAAEMNLSETAFVAPADDGFALRWFTPTVEVALCGHATLASAHILWETGRLPRNAVARFSTHSGVLSVSQGADAIVLDFPALRNEVVAPVAGLEQALGATAEEVCANGMDFLVRLKDEAAVRGVRPDFPSLATLPVRGVIVTAQADPGPFDFVSRFFAPASGVAEDPVTGSAHCALGPYWSRRLGKQKFRAFQASQRGGVVGVEVRGDRVLLSGRGVTIWRGELLV
jgi:PhzF family phenazine biosynthesis protein